MNSISPAHLQPPPLYPSPSHVGPLIGCLVAFDDDDECHSGGGPGHPGGGGPLLLDDELDQSASAVATRRNIIDMM